MCSVMSLWAVQVMVLLTCFLRVLGSLAHTGILTLMVGVGLVFLVSVALLVLFNTFKVLLLMDGGDLCNRAGFTGGLIDVDGSLRLLNSSHVRERDKALLRSILVGGVWNGFLSGNVRVRTCAF